MSAGSLGLSLSLSIDALGASSVRAAIAGVRDLGYSGVALPAWKRDFDPKALGATGARDLAAWLAKNGLAVSWLSAGPRGRFTTPQAVTEDVDRVSSMLHLAGRLRAAAVAAALGPIGAVDSAPAKLAREAVAALAVQADAAGAALAVIASPGETAVIESLLADFADAPVGVLIDPGALLFAGRDPVDAVEAAAKVVAVRACDSSPEAQHLAPGEGRVPWRDFLATLMARDYYGFVTVDFAPSADSAARAAKAAGVLRRFTI
jgi:sugar phosphate isomerase/epimerase